MLIYKTFEGTKPPGTSSLARQIRPDMPNICCMNVDNPAAYRTKGWSQSMDGAEKGAKYEGDDNAIETEETSETQEESAEAEETEESEIDPPEAA